MEIPTKPKMGRPKTSTLTLSEQHAAAVRRYRAKNKILRTPVSPGLFKAIVRMRGSMKDATIMLLEKGWMVHQIERDKMTVEQAEAHIAKWKQA